jgi:HlyD family secretion protein
MVTHPMVLSWLKPAFLPKLAGRWIRPGLLIVALLGAAGIGVKQVQVAAEKRSTANVLTQSLVRKTVPITITANGTVNAERSINLSPKSAGVIKTLSVKEGDQVSRGQVVAIMDDSNLRGQYVQMQGQLDQQEANLQRLLAGNRREDIAKAEAQLDEAKANLQQLQSGNRPQEIAQASAQLQQAQATLSQREAEVQRYQQLYREGAVSQQTLDQKLTDRAVAKTQVTSAEQALVLQNIGARPEQIAQAAARVEQQVQVVAALKAGTRPEEINQARAQVQAARGSLQTTEAQLQDLKILAPMDGVVLETYSDVGAFVSPSMSGSGASSSSSSILALASRKNRVEVNLSESQIAKIMSGQSVLLKVDALPGKPFTGRVAQIAPRAAVSQNVTSFEVRVEITSSTADLLKTGMNVEAQFQVGRLENALFVPNAAIVRQAGGEGVYVANQDQAPVFRPIETGTTAGSQTEVKSGLTGDEKVLLSPPSQVKVPSGLGLPKPPD